MGGRKEEGEQGNDKEIALSEDFLVSARKLELSAGGGGGGRQERQKPSNKSLRQRGGRPVRLRKRQGES